MAEFYVEGLLQRLLGLKSAGSLDGLARCALQMYTFFIVPTVPMARYEGHLQTNACGTNIKIAKMGTF